MTTAQQFVHEVRTWSFLRARSFPAPRILSPDSMRHRYIVQASRIEADEVESPRRLTFKDGSVAVRNEDDKFIWTEEVADAEEL